MVSFLAEYLSSWAYIASSVISCLEIKPHDRLIMSKNAFKLHIYCFFLN